MHSQASLSDEPLNDAESANDGNVDIPDTAWPDGPTNDELPEDASPGQHPSDTAGSSRFQKAQSTQALPYSEQGQARLPARETTKFMSHPLFELSTQMLAKRERQQQDPGSKNSLNNNFKPLDSLGTHTAPSTNPQDSRNNHTTGYQLWPENPWRSKTEHDPDLHEANKSIEHNSQPSDFRIPDTLRLVDSTARKVDDSVNDVPQTFFPVHDKDKPIKLSSVDQALFDFFTQLEFLVNQKASGHEILGHFESTRWLDEKIASMFGEEELDLLDQVVNAVADHEFGAPSDRSTPEMTTSRFQTIKCLALYSRLGLCRPRHWAAVLVKATVAMSSYKRATPPASPEGKFKSAVVLYIKSSSFLALWRAFLVEHNSPPVNIAALGLSQNYDQNGAPRGRNFQDAVFDLVPLWPRAGDPALDQNILGAFVLTVAFCSDLIATTAARRIPEDTWASVASPEKRQEPATASRTENATTDYASESDASKWNVTGIMARAIAPVMLNTTWARLLLAKLSVPRDQATAILSDVAKIIDATRQGMVLGSMQDELLRPSTDALIAWLDTATSDDSQAFGDWLLRGKWRIEWIIPTGIRRRLYHALFASYLRHGHLLEARELLRLRRGRLFSRAARSALLRRLYFQRDSLQFDGFWGELTRLANSGWWESTPRAWWYYRLRFSWEKSPNQAFEHLYALSRNGGVTERTYTRLRSFLVSVASHDMQKTLGSEGEIADPDLARSPKGADAMRDVCMMALRHSICTGNNGDRAFWLKQYRDQFDDDKEELDLASRLVFQCGLMSLGHLSPWRIANLFMVAIPLRERWLDGPILGVLRRDMTATSVAERWRLDLLMTEVAQAGRIFLRMVQNCQRMDKMRVVEALREFLLDLPLKKSHAHPATEVSQLINRTTAFLGHGRRMRPLTKRRVRGRRGFTVNENASFRQKDPLRHKANARGRIYRT